jgi:hypothetical protein
MNIILDRKDRGNRTNRTNTDRADKPTPDQGLARPNTKDATIQSRLTETSFANFLDGFRRVSPEDMLEAQGGRVRYVVDSIDSRGLVIERKYRLGGWLSHVDPALRYLRLFNPFAKKSWSVQLRKPGEMVTLYYMPPGTSDEVAALRNLLTQLENGQIKIVRAP